MISLERNLIYFKKKDINIREVDYLYYCKALDETIDEYYENNLCFFKFIYNSNREDNFNTNILKLENILLKINFLEFVYGKKIYIAEKSQEEIVFLIGIKALISKDYLIQHMKTFNKDGYIFKYLKTKKKIKKFVLNILDEENPNNLYYYCSHRMRYIQDNLHFFFEDGGFSVRPMINLYFNSYYDRKLEENYSSFQFMASKNSIYIYSLKKKSYLSLINLWILYMLKHSLYYNIKDCKIYTKLLTGEYKYYSELNYFSTNINDIYSTLSHSFFSINLLPEINKGIFFGLVTKYLVEAETNLYKLAPLLLPSFSFSSEEFNINNNSKDISNNIKEVDFSSDFIDKRNEFRIKFKKEVEKNLEDYKKFFNGEELYINAERDAFLGCNVIISGY